MEDYIIQEVSEHCKVTVQSMRSDSRKNNIVKARHLVFYFMRVYTKLSLHEIGGIMFRDHASVLHGCTSIKNQIESYAFFRKEILPLESRIKVLVEGRELAEYEVYQQNDMFIN